MSPFERIKKLTDYELNEPWKSIFGGKHILQMFIGLPIAFLLFYLWPAIIHVVDPSAGTFSWGILEPIVVACIYVMVGHSFAHVGAKLADDHYPNQALNGWDNSMVLYLVYFLAFMAAVLSVGR